MGGDIKCFQCDILELKQIQILKNLQFLICNFVQEPADINGKIPTYWKFPLKIWEQAIDASFFQKIWVRLAY